MSLLDLGRMIRLLSYLFLVVFACIPVDAAEWHGIKPGISTRADVVREFGECPTTASVCEFNLPDEDVYVTFSGPKTCPEVSEGTVLLIEREFVQHQSFAGLNLDRRRFKKFDPTWPRRLGYQGYIDNSSGLLLKSFNNKIFQVAYIPGLAARKLCPTYYRRPTELIATYVEHAPVVQIECPKEVIKAGKPLILRAWYRRGLSILLMWHASNIVEGQGRRKIELDTTGLAGRTIDVSVERFDSTGFISADSCKISFAPKEVVHW